MKSFGKKTVLYPMPVLIVATYDEAGNPNAMNAAWGGIWDTNQIHICLSEHKTTKNLAVNDEFTVAFADNLHVAQADYLGVESGNKTPNKLEVCGLHTVKAELVNAPIITEFPISIECKTVKFEGEHLIADIVNVVCQDEYLDSEGNIDLNKITFISYDGMYHNYLNVNGIAGHAFKDGYKFKR